MDILLVLLMSIDSMLACAACSAKNITIPWSSRAVIALIGTGCLAASFGLSRALSALLPAGLFRLVGCGALAAIALFCLFDEAFRRFSERLSARCQPLQFQLRGARFVLQVYAQTSRADRDHSGVLSASEAAVLALPLSLDSLLTGLCITATPLTAAGLLCFSVLCGMASASIGSVLGSRLRHTFGQNASILSGAALLCIACCKWFL